METTTTTQLYVSLLADGTVPIGIEVQQRRPLVWGSADLEVEADDYEELPTGGEAWLRCMEVDAITDEEGTIILEPWATVTWADGDGFNVTLHDGPLEALDFAFEWGGDEPVTRPGTYPAIKGCIGRKNWSAAVGHNEDDEGYVHIMQLRVT